MIKYIKRADLDITKYNACIDNSPNSRIYAYSWYLDIVATNWDTLILDDYKAVMPLTWRQKYFIKYIYKPCWTQQLGVFSADSIDEVLVQKFIKAIPRKFKKITIQFNSDNPISGKGVTKKVNYILPLNQSYEELFKNYKSVRRRTVRKWDSNSLTIEKVITVDEILNNHKKQARFGVKSARKPDYERLIKIADYLLIRNQIDIVIAKNENGVVIGGAVFLKDSKRLTYLVSAVSPEGMSSQVMTYIINNVINEYENSSYTLDFEGSMIKGVAFFFKSFGTDIEMYNLFEKKF